MICSKCHTDNPEGSTFCRECGNSLTPKVSLSKDSSEQTQSNPYQGNIPPVGNPFENNAPYQNAPQQNTYQQPGQSNPYQQPYPQSAPQQIPYYPNMTMPQDEHVTVGEWIGLYCLNLIPIVGTIIYIVLLFVWAFGDTPKKSLKTFSRANLILALIALVICIIVTIALVATGSSHY